MQFLNNKVLTFDQACEYLGYAKSYMYKLTSGGIIPFSKPNRKKIFFDREKLEAWMLSRQNDSADNIQAIASTYVNLKHK